jgi:hypothetical protein
MLAESMTSGIYNPVCSPDVAKRNPEIAIHWCTVPGLRMRFIRANKPVHPLPLVDGMGEGISSFPCLLPEGEVIVQLTVLTSKYLYLT